jgi:tetratricopeptide (TPR) repeat protein
MKTCRALLLLSLLAGCADMPTRLPTSEAAARGQALEIARIEARQLLEEARYRKNQFELERAADAAGKGNLLTRMKGEVDAARLVRLADQLVAKAGQLDALGDAALARTLREMANRLEPGKVVLEPTKRRPSSPKSMDTGPPAVTTKPDAAKQAAERRQEATEARERARHQLDAGLFRSAVASVEFAAELDPDAPELPALRSALETALGSRVRELDETAQQQYRRGLVREARDTWLELIEIDPRNNAAKAAVERANRVLHNLEQLRLQQKAAP